MPTDTENCLSRPLWAGLLAVNFDLGMESVLWKAGAGEKPQEIL